MYYHNSNQLGQDGFYPEDNNKMQSFSINHNKTISNNIKLLFNSSTDFYGRVTIYDLDIQGFVATE